MNVPIIGAGIILAGRGRGGGGSKKPDSMDEFEAAMIMLFVFLGIMVGGLFFWSYFIHKTVQEKAIDVANCEMRIVAIKDGSKQSHSVAMQQIDGAVRFDNVYLGRYTVRPTLGNVVTIKIYKMPNGSWKYDPEEVRAVFKSKYRCK